MNSTALSAFSVVVHMLLWNWVERGAVLESLNFYLLCLDGMINGGYITQFLHPNYKVHFYTHHGDMLLTPPVQHYPLPLPVFRTSFWILVDVLPASQKIKTQLYHTPC